MKTDTNSISRSNISYDNSHFQNYCKKYHRSIRNLSANGLNATACLLAGVDESKICQKRLKKI